MIPYGLNGHYHYSDCEALVNTDPECKCVGRMAKQISVLAEEVSILMADNRRQQRQLNNER